MTDTVAKNLQRMVSVLQYCEDNRNTRHALRHAIQALGKISRGERSDKNVYYAHKYFNKFYGPDKQLCVQMLRIEEMMEVAKANGVDCFSMNFDYADWKKVAAHFPFAEVTKDGGSKCKVQFNVKFK